MEKIKMNNIKLNAFVRYKDGGRLPIVLQSLNIEESENNRPSSNISVIIDDENVIDFQDNIVSHIEIMMNDDTIFFKGSIQKIEKCGDNNIITLYLENNITRYTYGMNNDENTRIMNFEVLDYERFLDVYQDNSIIQHLDNIFNIDDFILKDSLSIVRDNRRSIREINLNIACSWISKVEGEFEISNIIRNKFQGGYISTITPKSFEESWPCFGDRVSRHNSNSLRSRYYVGRSRLSIQHDIHDKNFGDKIIPISKDYNVNYRRYDCLLSICYEYDQYRREKIVSKFRNPFLDNQNVGISKDININLGNIYEYLENPTDTSFFRHNKKADEILEYTTKMITSYLLFSMRDSILKFSVPLSLETSILKTSSWINFQGTPYKITKLEFSISRDERIIKIEAKTFSNPDIIKKLKGKDNILEYSYVNDNDKNDDDNPMEEHHNIIHDIVVQNDGISQLNMIKNLVKNEGVNKKQIDHFLNDHRTTIQIIANPIKTKQCEEKIYEIGFNMT